MKQINFNQYTGTLLYNISVAADTAKLIKRVRSLKMGAMDRKERSMILERLTEYSVLKTCSLLDLDSRTVSFENLIPRYKNMLTLMQRRRYELGYGEIKKRYRVFIKRLKNNRNAKIAHTQASQQLGWDKKTTDRLNRLFSISGATPIPHVKPDNIHIVPSNFPHQDYHGLLVELQYLLFHEILYPAVSRPKKRAIY